LKFEFFRRKFRGSGTSSFAAGLDQRLAGNVVSPDISVHCLASSDFGCFKRIGGRKVPSPT